MSSNTVILGSGIIGCSTAFYLSQSLRSSPQSIHLVDPSPELFHCASGFAGGFVTADWFAPSVASLGALSFKLHKELAEKYNGRERWGYSSSTGTSLSQADDVVCGSGEDFLRNGTSRAQAATSALSNETNKGPIWLSQTEGASIEVIGEENSTAQIDPLRLCRFLLQECKSRGVNIHNPARAVSVSRDVKDHLASVRICDASGTETDIPCTRLIITAGAWSPKVFSTLFPFANIEIPVQSLAGHSLLVRDRHYKSEDLQKGCHAVFATDTLGFSPELFSRAGGEIYIAGLNTTQIPLPDLATEVHAQEKAIKQLKECAALMLGYPEGGEGIEVMRESLCFRPVTSSGRPLLSRIPDKKLGKGMTTYGEGEGGVFIAAGHGAWGISQSLGTGLCMSELVEGQKTSANISHLALSQM